jgi:carbamoyl-phosphate synthase large subunit
LSQKPLQLIGCDIDPTGIGKAFVDSYHVLPYAKDRELYLNAIDKLCRAEDIQVVIPNNETEIAVLSQLGTPPILPCGTIVLCHDALFISTYGDKLNCMNTLNGKVPLALFADGSDPVAVSNLIETAGFPLVVKSRQSYGSKSLHIVHSLFELQSSLVEVSLPLVQQYLDGDEFSAGAFTRGSFKQVMAFKREFLHGVGATWYAETSDDPEVLEYVQSIADAIGLWGSANIQVRKTKDGVRLLEINPRFSSLVAARAICGFVDVDWWLEMVLGMPITPPPESYKHIRFRRFFHELVDFGDGYKAVKEWAV